MWHALTVAVAAAEVVLCVSVALVRGELVEAHSLDKVNSQAALALAVHKAEVNLRLRNVASCGALDPLERLRRVLLRAA